MSCGLRVLALVSILLPLAPARAVVIGGGGSSRTDCLAVISADLNYPPPPDKPKRYRCADGAACDADHTVNGVCAFDVAICANSTFDQAHCTLNGVSSITVDHALDNGDRKFDPDFQALQSRIHQGIVDVGDPPNTDPDVCALPSRFLVPVVGPLPGNVCRRGKKEVKLSAYSVPVQGVAIRDRDKLKMDCDPAPSGCDAMAFYAGTFDRIQKQIFNQRCALSGCHDSQTQSGGLLLEEGASYTKLIDVTPTNGGAIAAGWKRVDAANASADNSYIFHKLTGDLDGTQGARMPLIGGALDDSLIEIVRLWIEAGAPHDGWVPGTF